MLKFVVFENDGMTARNFPPRHAYLVGPDDLPLQGDVVFDGELVRGITTGGHSTALSVQFEVGKPELVPDPNDATTDAAGIGLLTIPTCLLPDRDEPYLLTIELARHRIMLFLNKLEDWGLFDLPSDHPVLRQFDTAREAFTKALVAQRANSEGSSNGTSGAYNASADRLAAQTVALAIDAGEQLALIQADRQIKDRLSGASYRAAAAHYTKLTQEKLAPGSPVLIAGAGGVVLPGPPQIGCAISPGQFTEPMQRTAAGMCDFVVMPMRWVDMEPGEGKYVWAQTDRWIEWAVRTAKLPVFGGPLVDFRPSCVPEWLYIWENDYETLRDLVFEHVQSVVTRYRRTVTRWTVCSGLNVNTNFKVSFDQIMDLTRMCVLLVRKLHPTAKIQLEIAQPWGEYHAANRRSLPPLLYAEAIIQTGLSIDAIGLRLQMGHAQPGLSTRDLMTLSALLDRYANFEKPLVVSAIGAPSASIPAGSYKPRAGSESESAHEPGSWRGAWNEHQQADWLTKALTICCSKPYVHSVCWHELADAPGDAPEMPFGGLLSSSGVPKPAALRLMQLRQAIREGRSPLST